MRVYKHGKTWWLDYYVNGKNIRKSTHLTDRAAAEAVLATMKIAKSKQATSDAVAAMLETIYNQKRERSGLPIDAAWSTYTQTANAAGIGNVAADTLRKRKMHVQALIDWLHSDRPLVQMVQDVDGLAAAAYAAHLTALGLAPKTRQITIADLATVWKTLEIAVPELRNPWPTLRPRNVESKRHPIFTPEEEARVLEAARDKGDGWPLMCLISRHTGLRYGDVATLKWSDVNLKAGVIDIKPRKTTRHGIRVVIPIEKRTLTPALSEARKSTRSRSYLFPRHARAYLSTGMGPKGSRFSSILEAAKLKPSDGYTFHCWRHTFRTRLAEAGVSTETAMRLCGHTDERTSAVYDHADHLAELSAAIEAAAGK